MKDVRSAAPELRSFRTFVNENDDGIDDKFGTSRRVIIFIVYS